MGRIQGITIALALSACAASVSTARADDMIFQGVNGAAYGGFYVSPYTALDVTLNEVIQIYCLDFNHDVNFGQHWTANIRPLSASNAADYQYGSNNMSNPSFVTDPYNPLFGIFQRYEAAAWLFSQEGTAPSSRVLGIYEYAAWEVLLDTAHQNEFFSALASINDVDPVTHNTFQHDVSQALQAALSPANYGSVDLSRWAIVTPDPAGTLQSVQEFLTPVPEPSAAVPMVLGLLGLIAIRRRNRRTIS